MPAARSQDTQRKRLLAAIVHVSSEHGYEAATIARVIGEAGVSRRTFYACFADKQDCFLAALVGIEARVLAAATGSVERRAPQHAAAAVIEALVMFAQQHRMQARVLMNETMAAGSRALDARDRGVEALAALIEHAYRRVDTQTTVPGLPAEIIVGTTYRLLASRLRRGERGLADLREALLEWAAGYEQMAVQRQWRTLAPMASAERPLRLSQGPLRAPPPLAPGRPARSAPAVAENHRLRIVFATAEVIRRDGYAASSVAEITRAAGLDGRAFYRLFTDKHDAFTAVHEFVFQNAMAAATGGFFAVEEWPQRVWEAGRTFARHLEQNSALVHASIVEGHAGGPEAAERLEGLLAGFTIFLQEGYQYQPPRQGVAPSRLALEAIAQANLELLYRQVRAGHGRALTGVAAHFAYVCLAPFVGAARAGALMEELLRGGAAR